MRTRSHEVKIKQEYIDQAVETAMDVPKASEGSSNDIKEQAIDISQCHQDSDIEKGGEVSGDLDMPAGTTELTSIASVVLRRSWESEGSRKKHKSYYSDVKTLQQNFKESQRVVSKEETQAVIPDICSAGPMEADTDAASRTPNPTEHNSLDSKVIQYLNDSEVVKIEVHKGDGLPGGSPAN